jgi:hypothetical protein
MQFTSSLIALALAATNVMASDVYSTFYASEGQITPNFDIANNGCFSVDGAIKVSFSQYADGPYCLTGWVNPGCTGSIAAKQTFRGVDSSSIYALEQEIADQGSYSWNAAGAC